MKKLLVLLLGLCLIGCSRANYNEETEKEAEVTSKEITTVCTGDNTSITFYAKGDQILKEERRILTDVSAELAENTNRDELLARINENLTSTYGDIKGVEFQTSWEGDSVVMVITVDFEKADQQELYNVDLLEEIDKDAEYISLESSLLGIQKSGYACKVTE